MRDAVISEDLRLRLAQSMALVERRRAAIVARIPERMAAQAQLDENDPGAAASILFGLLIDGASDLAAFAGLRDLSRVRRDHRHLGIAGRQYSRFGLALGPSIHAVLGVAMPPETLSAWCDAFWIVIREITSEDGQERAGGVPIQLGPGLASA
jgi:hemoglobin-like flavoprotein